MLFLPLILEHIVERDGTELPILFFDPLRAITLRRTQWKPPEMFPTPMYTDILLSMVGVGVAGRRFGSPSEMVNAEVGITTSSAFNPHIWPELILIR